MFIDIGHIGAKNQAGHAHADTFNFELYVNNIPFFVDTGSSTYEIGSRRSNERSTSSPNTITYKDENSSEVWAGFRVGSRANVIAVKELSNSTEAIHNGYRKYGVNHLRRWDWSNDEITITDKLMGINKLSGKAYFHLYPGSKLHHDNDKVIINELIEITVRNSSGININKYDYAPEFNVLLSSECIVISFEQFLETTIKII